MRKRIYEIIEVSDGSDFWSRAYDLVMIVIITMSIVPLAFKEDNASFQMMDKIAVSVFIVDYILRLITADLKYGEHSIISFIKYPFSFFAIIDLISILPSFSIVSCGFRLFRLSRVGRSLRVFRIFRLLRYSNSFRIIVAVLDRSKDALLAVCTLAFAYVLIAALVIFNVEPESFETFFDAVYWATVSLTTMGYGDIYPVTRFGRLVTMVSAFLGIAIVALPSGIITAGYMNEINECASNTEDKP